MDEDFMLYNDTAKRLYHRYAQTLPIFDYHCHLSAREIYENRPAENIAQLWLEMCIRDRMNTLPLPGNVAVPI